MATSSSTAQQKPTQAAFLHRCVSLNDRHSTQVLTFILPPHLVKGYLGECSSKDFTYGYQKWRVTFTRDDTHLGCYLTLRSPAESTEVTLDFSFIILNRSHFTGSETYQERGIVFDQARQRFGRTNFLCVTDLERRGFLFPDQKALVEVELRSACTEFRQELQLPREPRELHCLERIETSYFAFAGCDWNLAVHLREPDEFGNLRHCSPPCIQMYRHSSFDHWCRVRYRVTFQLGETVYQSDVIDQMLDAKGYGDSYPVGQTSLFAHLSPRYPLKVSISLLSMWPVTTVDLIPTSRHKSAARCYDTDKQQWVVETDILGRQLKLRLFYSDIKNVPRHFTRQVSWNAYVVPCDPDRPIVKAINGPFTNYYSQKEQDEGFDVEMDLPVEEICDNTGGYTERETGYLTAQIEWLHSHLLYQDFYHHYDDLARLHKHQMSREVSALQSENYSLEKQLFSYQISISRKDAGFDGPAAVGAATAAGGGGASSSIDSRDSGIYTSEQQQQQLANRQRHNAGWQNSSPQTPQHHQTQYQQQPRDKYGLP